MTKLNCIYLSSIPAEEEFAQSQFKRSTPIHHLHRAPNWREKPGVLCGGGAAGRRNSRHQWSSGRLDVIRYRADTQPIITDPPSIFLSRKSRNINNTTLVADRRRKSPQKSRRRRRRSRSTASSRPFGDADDVGEQWQQNGRLFGSVSGRAPNTPAAKF